VVKAERDDWSGQIVFGSVQTWRGPRGAPHGQVSHLVIEEAHPRPRTATRPSSPTPARQPKLKLLASRHAQRGDVRSLRKTFLNIAYPCRSPR